MDILTMLSLAVALGMDAFAVALAVSSGLCLITFRHVFRLTWHFGLFQSLMTLAGWFGGASISGLFGGLNNWIAMCLLVFIGLKMIRESSDTEKRLEGFDPTRGWSLVGLSMATSLDALAVGISFSLMGTEILAPVLVIGVVALLMTFVGMKIGHRAGKSLGAWAERLGGAVLVLIGAKLFIGSMI